MQVEQYMQRCLELAQKGTGMVSPNPMVGCVIVHKDRIIGEGYHRQFGSAHAEVNAIDSVKDKSLLRESTLYVNLEPCTHHGKTPPCCDLLLKHNIQKVVIGCTDANPTVNGAGIKMLKSAGVEVDTGVLEKESLFLNRRFFTFTTTNRPYIILKWAQTANGMMAGTKDDDQYISGEEALQLVHKWRTEEDAFMVGTKTVLMDNPTLTARKWKGRNPIRISIDRHKQFDQSLNLLNDEAQTLLFTEKESEKRGNTNWIKADMEYNFGADMCAKLYDRGIQSLVVEGGKILLQYFMDLDLWDEARILVSKKKVFPLGLKAPLFNHAPAWEQELPNDKVYYFYK